MLEELARKRFSPGDERGLPTEAAPPQDRLRELKQLGTLDADAAALEAKAVFSTDELKRKAELERQRRIEAGVSDAVEDMQANEAPPFDSELVGKWLEIC